MTDEAKIDSGAGGGGGGGGEVDFAPFYANLSEENKAVFSARAFDKGANGKPVDANALLDTIRNQDQLIGKNNLAPPRLDDDAELAKWPGFKALGVPDTADKYDLKRPEADKLPKGMAWDEDGEKVLRDALLTGKTPQKFAQAAFDKVVAMQVARYSAFEAHQAEQVRATEAALKADWGTEYDAKKTALSTAAVTLAEKAGVKGLDGAALTDRLAGLYGDMGAMKVLDYIARGMGEDGMKGGGGGGGGANTPEAAKAEIDKLNQDSDFLAAYNNADHAGHRAAVERMSALNRIAHPEKKAQ